ncbi:MAG: sigma-54-dependent Fis family transcriptional regulator, partial [Planctomycetales bacterium]|nr:sigma-54-dependent Fis family transcriptional regulator [Planctomycetales bacterium]
FLDELQGRRDATPVVMVTAHGSVSTAVHAMRCGAFDYLEKPFDVDQLEGVVKHALESAQVVGRRSEMVVADPDLLVGDSPAMRRLKQRIALVAATDVTVLITGESGTGKELVARAIHCASPRHDRPLVSLNCPALSTSLMESELFGHEQGAFTNANKPRLGRFELADQGTIFLDEVTEIELGLQAKLLRVLQEQTFERVGSSDTRQVDVRVIAATNRDVAREVAEGRFREDLYFRLAVVPIEVPPLRDRLEDIPALASHLLRQAAARCGRTPLEMESGFVERLQGYHWPGNVRELENLMTRVTVLAQGDRLRAADIDEPKFGASRAPSVVPFPAACRDTPPTCELERIGSRAASSFTEAEITGSDGEVNLEQAERQLIESTLARFEGHRERTAKALGIGVRTLSNKLRAWGYQPRQGSYRNRKNRAA